VPPVRITDFELGEGGDFLQIRDMVNQVIGSTRAFSLDVRWISVGDDMLLQAQPDSLTGFFDLILLEGVQFERLEAVNTDMPEINPEPTVTDGTDGDDTINGTDVPDLINGFAGDDTLGGGRGNDILNGDEGEDSLRGDDGNDILNGGDDNDFLFGGSGDDTLNGGAGDDELQGNSGQDTLDGGAGNDDIRTRGGTDTLIGGEGDDIIRVELLQGNTTGEEGATVFGGAGSDTLLYQAGGTIGGSVDLGSGDDLVELDLFGFGWTMALGEGNDRIVLESLGFLEGYEGTLTDFVAGDDGEVIIFERIRTEFLQNYNGISNPLGTGHFVLSQDGQGGSTLEIYRDPAGPVTFTLNFPNVALADFTAHNFGGLDPSGRSQFGPPIRRRQ